MENTLEQDTGSTLIDLQGLSKVFYTEEVETHALSDIHLDIKAGEFVSIAGPSGCGKTTLLSILGLLDSPTMGDYLLDGEPVAELTASQRAKIRNQAIGFIFQAFNLIGDLTVYENVELPLTYRGNGNAVMDLMKELHDEGATICMVTHDPRYAHGVRSNGSKWRTVNHYPSQLSGGRNSVRTGGERTIVAKLTRSKGKRVDRRLCGEGHRKGLDSTPERAMPVMDAVGPAGGAKEFSEAIGGRRSAW